MNRAWLAAFSDFWNSFSFPMWLTILIAAIFTVALVIAFIRAERSVANGALTVITLVAIGAAVVAMSRTGARPTEGSSTASPPSVQLSASLPALSCLDGIAGEAVQTSCERALFASADAVAAAVSYTASQITRLRSFGNVAAADKVMTPELQALRRAIERDRYGIVAQVLMARDGCTLVTCTFFRSLTNSAQISANMSERLYEGFVGHHAASWNAPPAVAAPVASLAPQPAPVAPGGKTLSGDFPSAASIPPINIMTPEPALPSGQPEPRAPTDGNASAPAKGAPVQLTPAKKQSAQKSRAQEPVPLAPPAADDDN